MRCCRSPTACSSSTSASKLAEGEPQRGDGRPRGAARLHGDGSMMTRACCRPRGLTAFYGDAQALFGIDFELDAGELVAIIGANGAGKSHLPEVPHRPGARRRARRCASRARPIGGLPPGEIVRRGLAMVPEGRRLFPSLSVEENLLMGALRARAGPWNLERALRAVPDPRARSAAQPGHVAVGRPAADGGDRPRADEQPRACCCATSCRSGLAPIVIREIYAAMPAHHAPKA